MELSSVYSNNIEVIEQQISVLEEKKQVYISNLLKTEIGQQKLLEYFSDNLHIALCYCYLNNFDLIVSRGETNTEVNVTFKTIADKYLKDKFIGYILDTNMNYRDDDYIQEAFIYVNHVCIPIIEEKQAFYDWHTYFDYYMSNKYGHFNCIKSFAQKNIEKIFDLYKVSDNFACDIYVYLNTVDDEQRKQIEDILINELFIKKVNNEISLDSLCIKKEELYNCVKNIMTDY